ncbi:MAG: TRAP transporter small permease [Clostridiaceae bacterium]|nr:TRAP transporter small permease [Clostridiaceae bacterium]
MGLRAFPWGDELIRLTSLWVSFMAASLAAKEGLHLCVSFLIEKHMPKKLGNIVRKIANLVVVATLGYLTYFGILRTMDNIQTSLLNVKMSMAWFYAAIPVGCFYLLIDYVLILIYGEHPFSKKNEVQCPQESIIPLDKDDGNTRTANIT